MTYLKKHYLSTILVPTAALYIIVGGYGMRHFGAVIGTLLANLTLIAGIGTIWILDKLWYDDEFDKRDMVSEYKNARFSYALVAMLWFVGQFIFLWVYKTFGDAMYDKTYGLSFMNMDVFGWTIILTCIVAPVTEEFVFRYLLFGRLINKMRGSYAWYLGLTLISTLLFGISHGTMVHQIVVLPLGLILCSVMYRTNNLMYPILGHMLFNSMSIWLSGLLYYYQSYLGNMMVTVVAFLLYGIVCVGIIGYVVLAPKKN